MQLPGILHSPPHRWVKVNREGINTWLSGYLLCNIKVNFSFLRVQRYKKSKKIRTGEKNNFCKKNKRSRYRKRSFYLITRSKNQFISLTVNIDDLHRRIFLQMFTQLRDINIHASGIKVIVISPDILQCVISL